MTQSFIPDDTSRYGYQEGELDNDHGNTEIAYPDGWTIPGPEEHFPETPEKANPGVFYVQKVPKPVDVSPVWTAGTVTPILGGDSILLLAANPRRKRALIYTPTAAGKQCWVSPNKGTMPIGTTNATGFTTVQVPPAGIPLVIMHTGPVYVFGIDAGAVVAFTEESFTE